MTGPEHYREAELLLKRAEDQGFGIAPDNIQAQLLATAQVHATLALAAATAGLDAIEGPNGGSATGRSAEGWAGWNAVLGGVM